MASFPTLVSLHQPAIQSMTRMAPCQVCGERREAHGPAAAHCFVPASREEDAARRLIQSSSLHHTYEYRRSMALGTYAVFGLDGWFAADWVSAAAKLFPGRSDAR